MTHKKRLYSIGLLVLVAVIVGGLPAHLAGATPPSQTGQGGSESLYLTMRDGTQIAVDVWYPALDAGQKVPAIFMSTRYWRGIQNMPTPDNDPEVAAFLQNGYAVVKSDARGTGASSGARTAEWSPAEVADMGEVVDWIAAQPWSNGRVAGVGVSYEGNMAELLSVSNRPAVKAVAPLYDDFDPLLYLAMPGGVFNSWFLQAWGSLNLALDTNNICILAGVSGDQCTFVKANYPGVRRVDADPDGTQLDQILAERQPLDIFGIMQKVTYRDDSMGLDGETAQGISPYGLRSAIEQSGVPMYVWVGWLDAATVNGALSRYLTFSNPQKLIIGPWSHGGGYHTDPFLLPDTPPDPAVEKQFAMRLEFFDSYLKNETPPTPERSITYYTMNAGTWTTTQDWPPAGFETQSWYFGPDHTLAAAAPAESDGADEYTVDFTATTGETTRWHTQLDGQDVIYPDRAQEDQKLLTYTSAPLPESIEITGTPVITLYVSSTASDGAFHVYLEDVAPDGRVTYITEGELRALHRKISDAEPPYVVLGPYHSFLKADALPLVPGDVAEISFALYATSVRIDQGHSLRIAVAGADASVFARYPAEGGSPVLSVQRSSVYPSHVDLPVKAAR